jgi:hypothetical protein
MQTSRFQIGLIAALSCALGLALSTSPAIGYPAGPSVSYGLNPIVSSGGLVYRDESTTAVTAPADQDVIVTDVLLSSNSNSGCIRSHQSTLTLSSGTVVGKFDTSSSWAKQFADWTSAPGLSVNHTYGSGLRVPAGETLTLSVTQYWQAGSCSGTHGVAYSVSGYQSQP